MDEMNVAELLVKETYNHAIADVLCKISRYIDVDSISKELVENIIFEIENLKKK